MAPCKFFAQGRCVFGASCMHSHEAVNPDPAPTFRLSGVETSPRPTATQAVAICPFFVRGLCKYGAQCRLPHGTSPELQEMESMQGFPTTALPTRVRKDKVSSKELKISWRPEAAVFEPGSAISFEVSPPKVDEKPAIKPSSMEGEFSREFQGAKIVFGDGAEVKYIQLLSDSSTIQIEGLNAVDNAATISQLLSSLKFTIPEAAIVIRGLSEKGAVAEVTFEDPNFAKTVMGNLEMQHANGSFTRFTIKPVARLGVAGTSGNRLQLSTVTCTWYQATRNGWLSYSSRQRAANAKSALESRQVHQRSLECSIQQQSPSRRLPNITWTVNVSNLHGSTTDIDLRRVLTGDLQPNRISLGCPSYSLSDSESAGVVEQLLRRCGGLDTFQCSAVEKTSKMKAMATFSAREKATEVVRKLHQTEIPELGMTKLFVNQVITVKYNVLNPIVKVLEPEFNKLRDSSWHESHTGLKMYPQKDPKKPFTTLRISGENLGGVAKVKAAIERMLAGRIALKDNSTLWDPYFLEPGALTYLNELSNRLNVYIYRDARRSRLVIYAISQEALAAMNQVLLDKVAAVQAASQIIILSSDLLKYAMQGGMQRLKARFGQAIVLNVTVNPKTIKIVGSKADLEEAHALLINTSSPAQGTPEQSGECVVCWCTEENSLLTACGHVYCTDCFANQVSSNDATPVRCFGDQSKCKHIFNVNELKKMLSGTNFEDMLQRSFAAFIRSHPHQFQYCPTPDCPQIYRKTNEGDTFVCSTCLTTVCTTCNVASHDGMSCEEYKDLTSEGTKAFHQYKKEHDVRDCPKCKVGIQKSFGCNHMECANCGIHICWYCMALFETGPEVYRHMGKMHEGIY